MLHIAWVSANLFGHSLLKEAINIKNISIDIIITLSNDSTTQMYDSIDKKRWYEFGIPVSEISNINDTLDILQSYSIDMIILCGWRQILKKEILNIIPLGIVGFHPTLLPKGRGPAPIINTILEGFHESGVTMYYISEGLDDGDIIGQIQFPVNFDDKAEDIYNKVLISGRQLILKYLPLLVEGKAPRIPQNHANATYFPKRTIQDNEIFIDNDSVEIIYRKIRAFSKPYRGAYIVKDDKKIIIWEAEIGG